MKKTISLPLDLAEEAETRARGEGKTLSAVIQGALRLHPSAVRPKPDAYEADPPLVVDADAVLAMVAGIGPTSVRLIQLC